MAGKTEKKCPVIGFLDSLLAFTDIYSLFKLEYNTVTEKDFIGKQVITSVKMLKNSNHYNHYTPKKNVMWLLVKIVSFQVLILLAGANIPLSQNLLKGKNLIPGIIMLFMRQAVYAKQTM